MIIMSQRNIFGRRLSEAGKSWASELGPLVSSQLPAFAEARKLILGTAMAAAKSSAKASAKPASKASTK
jgi:hypothetical protein